MKKLSFEIDGQLKTGYAQIVGDQTWVHLDGRCFIYSPQMAQKSAGPNKQNQKKSGKVVSPMPGKITKILVKLGDQVEANQSLLVMEAMKMEYSLKSQVSGKVQELHCELASQVQLGALLAVIG
jgi:biotin carboxyl carrier protein